MKTDPSLNPAWAGHLAQSLSTEHTLSAEASARIKQSLMQKIAERLPVVNVRRDEAWVQLGKRIQVKVLHDDGISLSWLLKLLPGGSLPVHDHADGAEECMILEGQLRINGEDFFAGDYQIALPGSVHHEVCSEQGSLVYLRSPSSRRQDLMGA
ncbi:cupin domain-containing protein [Variovorax sp. PCZ-1]|uniref:cupin domain-containing protein n=1 Tax=Variovorax sp. PCZ-1 TaxID=2835533 RepID=UPI001BCC010F|nr:cupin domain-containing protein [Variovorax sp. PCZ-1]MBS7808448.1 cupin domain-containing protein [Variovorax sp. PCZ-1]